MMHAIRAPLADDGTWLLVDIKALDTFAENVTKNPMASLMYGISVFSCMSSALSEPGGAGLGTLGLPPAKAEAMAREAGFTRFRQLPVDHAVNAFYEVRPVTQRRGARWRRPSPATRCYPRVTVAGGRPRSTGGLGSAGARP